MVVQGLIFIIPIVGWIALTGWLALTIDNYRAGRRELPPAGFHLERGIPLFVVLLVYAIAISIPISLLYVAAGAGHNGAISGLAGLINLALTLLFAFLAPSIIVHTYRGGISGGFEVNAIWQTATANTSNTIVAGLLVYVARLIGGLGSVLVLLALGRRGRAHARAVDAARTVRARRACGGCDCIAMRIRIGTARTFMHRVGARRAQRESRSCSEDGESKRAH